MLLAPDFIKHMFVKSKFNINEDMNFMKCPSYTDCRCSKTGLESRVEKPSSFFAVCISDGTSPEQICQSAIGYRR